MTLSTTDLQALKRPFAANEHEFIRGFVYISEEAVCNRIEEIDPAWKFEILHVDQSGENVVVHARMTINDVPREGIGMQKINEKAGEAEKGAATDAMKRCARLFGVGRYLLGAPEQAKFNAWLSSLNGPQRSPATPPVVAAVEAAGGKVAPKVKPWAEAYKDFVSDWLAKDVKQDTLLDVLKIDRFGQWTGTKQEADAAVTAYLAAQPMPQSA